MLAAIDGPGGTSISHLVAATGLRPDRIRRLLAVCEQAGISSRAPDGDAAELAWGVHGWHRAIVESTLRGPARQLVSGTAARAGNTTYLTVRLGMRSSTVAECIVDGTLTMGSWLGRPAQLIGSDGRAVVAAACIVGPGPEMAAGMPAIKRLVCQLAESMSGLLQDPGGAVIPPTPRLTTR